MRSINGMLRAIFDRIDIVAAGAVGAAGALYGLGKPLTLTLAIAAAVTVFGGKMLWRRLKGTSDA